jgi:hypothetical protein
MGSSATTTEVHILIGCADARDIGGSFIAAVGDAQQAYLDRGVAVELHALRTPGTFVTPDLVEDLRAIIAATQRARSPGAAVRYFVHVQTHGEIDVDDHACGLHRLRVVAGSRFNCGMLGATGVGLEMERLLLARAPTLPLRGGVTCTIDSEDAIRALLRERYAHDGFLAGDWVRSIDDLRTHARLQKAVLRRALDRDPALRALDLAITAGIQDYGKQAYIRVDGDEHGQTFWDDVYVRLRERTAALSPDHPDVADRTRAQAPSAGLFAMADIRASRGLAAEWHARARGAPTEGFGPNTIFALAGGAFDVPAMPYGPYTIAGFFYGVVPPAPATLDRPRQRRAPGRPHDPQARDRPARRSDPPRARRRVHRPLRRPGPRRLTDPHRSVPSLADRPQKLHAGSLAHPRQQRQHPARGGPTRPA